MIVCVVFELLESPMTAICFRFFVAVLS